jgi:hypothetical protein
MANGIKYNVSTQTQALKKGNFWIATGDVGKGSDYYSEIPPPVGGYTIYLNKASGGPSIICPANDAQLISWTKSISGNTYATAAECLNWFAGQSDKMVVNESYPAMITDQLVLSLDSGFTASYPRTGTVWYNMSGTSNSTLANGAVFDSGSGGIRFDGSDDYVDTAVLTNSIFSSNDPFSVSIFVNPTANISTNSGLVCNQKYESEGSPGGFGVVTFATNQVAINLTKNDGTGIQSYQVIASMTLSINSWQNITYTYEPSTGTVRAYKNGSLVNAGTSASYKWTPEARSAWIGANTQGGWGTHFTGLISNVCIYKKTLSSSEILQNYYLGLIVTSGLVFAVDAGNIVSYEPGSTNAYDLTGNVTAGTLNNGTYSIGNWFVFDGVNDEIVFPHDPDYKNQSISVDFWVNLDAEGSGRHVMFTSWYGFTVEVNNPGGSVAWGLNGLPGQYMNAGTITYGSTTHIACTYDTTSNTQKIYLNGVMAGSQIVDGTITYDTSQLIFSGSWDRTKGRMGAMKIYNKELSASEVLQNYNATKSRFGLL